MSGTKVLQIITSNIMEGTGFKSYIEQANPMYEVDLHILSMSSFSRSDLYSELWKIVNKECIVIIDTDSLEDEPLLDFLKHLNEIDVKCIIYSKLSTPGLIIKAREFLINGYVSKSSSLNCITDCLNVIELGGTYYDSCFSDLLKQIMVFEKGLSVSEKRLFDEVLLFGNRTIKELSKILNISKHTVEVHLSNLYKKAHVNGYTELVSCFSL